MIAYAAGDRRAFGELFARLAPRIHGFFQRSFRDASVADDLLQMTFLKLHHARHRYDPAKPLRPWVFTIAAGIRRDELRRRFRLPRFAGEDEIARVAESDGARVPDPRLDTNALDALRAAIDRLPESQRVVLHLHRYEGLTFAQIATILETTSGAVRVRASRAYETLRQELTPFLREQER